MIPPEEAWRRLAPHLAELESQRKGRRAGLGEVLAANVLARTEIPGQDVSAMDGYALTGEAEPGIPIPVVGTIAAGDPPGIEIEPGAAVRIMTGAPVPAGADRVVPVELTDGGDERVSVSDSVQAGANIRRAGEIQRRGSTLLPKGALVTPGAIASLAGDGHSELETVRRPRVAVLTTGDEVVPPETEPEPGQLRDTHTDFLLAAGTTLGIDVVSHGIAADDPALLRERIELGLEADVLVVCGGVSMGEFDLVERALVELGLEILFDRVAVKPGKPLVGAVPASEVPDLPRIVFGLPGNPASVMVCFWLFVRPAIRRLIGLEDGYLHGILDASLGTACPGAKDRDWFLPARVEFHDGDLVATPVVPRGSHDTLAYARGTALLRVPAGAAPRETGEPCQILPLIDWPEERVRGSSPVGPA